MSSRLVIKWQNALVGSLPKPGATDPQVKRLQDVVDSMPRVREAVSGKQPTLLFFFSEAKAAPNTKVRAATNGKAKPEKENWTPAAQRSLDVYEKILSNDNDQRLKILMRFFQCVNVDVTKVVGLHPDITEQNAPLLLVLDENGKLATILPPGRIDSKTLATSLYGVLKKSRGDIDAVCTSMIKIMADLERAYVAKSKIEKQMDERRLALDTAKSKDTKRLSTAKKPASGPSQSVTRAQDAVDQLQPTLDAAIKACDELIQKDTDLLRKSTAG